MQFSRELELKGSDASREKTKEAKLGAPVARRASEREREAKGERGEARDIEGRQVYEGR